VSGKRSRERGCRGERQAAALLTEAGFPAHRGRQYRGGQDSPDVVCPALDGRWAIEVKMTERLRLYAAVEQARRDGGPERVPLVLHRRARGEWLAILPAGELLRLLKQLEERR
jgi:Holliday junction resolvase